MPFDKQAQFISKTNKNNDTSMMKVSRIGNPPNTTLKFDFNQIFRSTFKTLTQQIDVNCLVKLK